MPTLHQSLQKHDLGHLQIIAEGWGLSFSAPDDREGRKALAELLLKDRALLEEIAADLPPESQGALAALLGQDGQMLWHLFTQQFGQIREMGPGRRDREQPHLSPISNTERLWYLGLIGRDFLDSPAGPQEYAYIPEDLQPLLPDFLRTAPAQPLLSRPATPAERAYPFPVDDQIINHAVTLLAALRMGPDPAAQVQKHGQTWPLSIPELTTILHSAGLLSPDGRPQSEPVRSFLEAPRAQALAQLANAWLKSPDYDDLAAIPGLVLEGEPDHDSLAMRRAAIDLILTLPRDQWWSLPALISATRTQQPNFLRPRGDYDSWYLRDEESGAYLRGFEHWEQVEGAYLRTLITGPLHWLGFIELAAADMDASRNVFRFSPWFDDLLANRPPSLPWEEDQTPVVDSQGQVLISPLAPRAARYLTARFCEWRPLRRELYSYSLSPASLEAARQQGLTLDHLLGVFKRYGGGQFPPNTLKALKQWERFGTQVKLQQAVVLTVTRPEILEALRKSPAKRFLGTPLGPTSITISPGALDKVREILISMGYLSEIVE